MRPRVAIVGAGVAGAAAALSAARCGAEVVLYDADERFGGTARRGGGGFCAPGTSTQRGAGVGDDPRRALQDLLQGQRADVNARWARFYFRAAARFVHDTLLREGVKVVDLLRFERDSVARWHYPSGGGAGLMKHLESSLHRTSQVQMRMGQKVTDFGIDVKKAFVVTKTSGGGSEETVFVDALILASGGFAQNRDLVRTAMPSLPTGFLTAGGENARGDLLPVLIRLGAATTGLDRIYFYPFITADFRDPARGVAIRGTDHGIWLNSRLERFLDEDKITLGQSAAEALMQQEGAFCWAVVDAAMTEGLAIADHYREPGEKPASILADFVRHSPDVVTGETLDALAERMDVDPDGLKAVISAWNTRAGKPGIDPATGRDMSRASPIEQAPFMAIKLRPGARKTLGGVRTDLRSRVLDSAGRPLPGLFAAGEICGFAGGSITGRKPLEGMMVGVSFFAGLVAGRHAARHSTGDRIGTSAMAAA